jgi:large-conductance mechanosensitive channel
MESENIVEEINLDVKKEIEEATKKFNLRDLIVMFSVIGSSLGTIMALNTTNVIKEFSKNIINPLIDLTIGQILPFNSFKFTIKNVTISFGSFLYELANLLVVLLILYLVLKYVFDALIADAIEDKQTSTKIFQKQNDKIITVLHNINKKLSPAKHTQITNKLDKINNTIKTAGEQNYQYILYPHTN